MCSPSYQVGYGLFVEHRQGGTPLSLSHVHRRIANCWSKPCKETKRKQCCQRKRVTYGPGSWSRCKSWPAASILNPPSPPGTTSATKHARKGYVHTSPQQHPDMLQHHHMPHINHVFAFHFCGFHNSSFRVRVASQIISLRVRVKMQKL